jgi:hypothetical protein
MIEAFKTEIIEAEKSRTDLLKWKLIIVAALRRRWARYRL